MTDWDETARDNLKAARLLTNSSCYRSCASRSYYAAFSAVAFALRGHAQYEMGRETPPHHQVPFLMDRYLRGEFAVHRLRELKARIRRLYRERLVADYRSVLTVDQHAARQSRQDAHAVCRELGVLKNA